MNTIEYLSKRVVEVMGAKENALISMRVFLEPLFKDYEYNPEALAEARRIMNDYGESIVNDPDFLKGISGLYGANYTEEELRQLLEFYESPLGQKALKNTGKFAQESNKVVQRVSQRYLGKLEAECNLFSAKYE